MVSKVSSVLTQTAVLTKYRPTRRPNVQHVSQRAWIKPSFLGLRHISFILLQNSVISLIKSVSNRTVQLVFCFYLWIVSIGNHYKYPKHYNQ